MKPVPQDMGNYPIRLIQYSHTWLSGSINNVLTLFWEIKYTALQHSLLYQRNKFDHHELGNNFIDWKLYFVLLNSEMSWTKY